MSDENVTASRLEDRSPALRAQVNVEEMAFALWETDPSTVGTPWSAVDDDTRLVVKLRALAIIHKLDEPRGLSAAEAPTSAEGVTPAETSTPNRPTPAGPDQTG